MNEEEIETRIDECCTSNKLNDCWEWHCIADERYCGNDCIHLKQQSTLKLQLRQKQQKQATPATAR